MNHEFTNLPLTDDGWTDLLALFNNVPDYNNSRIIYVSDSEGNDSTGQYYSKGDSAIGNDPFNPTGVILPYKTVGSGFLHLRNNYADILLFKRGDTFPNRISRFDDWIFQDLAGPSSSGRMIFSAYGSGDRPIFNPTTYTIYAVADSFPLDNIIFSSLDIYGEHKDPDALAFQSGVQSKAGIIWLGGLGTTNLLVEDVRLRYCGSSFQSSTNFCFRRNTFLRTYEKDSDHSSGMFIGFSSGIFIEDCTFHHNGWHESVSGAQQTAFNHNFYIATTSPDVTFKNNISTYASSHGLQARTGGVITNNLFIKNPIGILFGGGDNPVVGGVAGTIYKNIFWGGGDIGTSARGTAIDLVNIRELLINQNIISRQTSTQLANNFIIFMNGESDGSPNPTVGINNVDIRQNLFYDWQGPVRMNGSASASGLEHLKFYNVNFSSNYFGELISSNLIFYSAGLGSIISSDNNKFYSAAPSDEWFIRHGVTGYTLTQWKAQVGDTTSSVWDLQSPIAPDMSGYMSYIGQSGGDDEFIALALTNNKNSWNYNYTASAVVDWANRNMPWSQKYYAFLFNNLYYIMKDL